jgi:hypothetical protein
MSKRHDCEEWCQKCHPVTAPLDPMAEAVDGAREAFREREMWFYRNAPECQEARKHSFSRQADVAFTLALREAALARPSDTRRVVVPVLSWHDAGWQREVLADETGKVRGGIEHATTVVNAHANGASIGQYVTATLAKAAVELAAINAGAGQ